MIVYLPSDRITLDFGDVKVVVSPLTTVQQDKLSQFVQQQAGQKTVDHAGMVKLALKMGVKDIIGVQRPDGTKFKPQIVDNELTDDSLDILQRIGQNAALIQAGMKLMQSREEELKEIKGVKVKIDSGQPSKKKAK